MEAGPIQTYLGTGKLDCKPFRTDVNTITKMKNTIKGIDSSLNKGEVFKKNKVFYRGDDYGKLKNWGFPNYQSLKAKEGKIFRCDNYISTGVSSQGAFGGEVEWRIKCNAGKKYGAYVNEISHYFDAQEEFEFVIKRGANIKINKVTLKDGVTYIDANIVDFSPKKVK